MAEIATDSTWQLMGIVVIILGVVLITFTIAESYLPHTKKTLAYEIRTYTPDFLILSGRRMIPGSIVMMLKIVNTGNVPITPLDFGGALCFHLEDGRKIYSAEVVESTPTILRPAVSIESESIMLHPTRLAGHESLTIKAVIDGRTYGVRVDARLTCLNNHVPRSMHVNALPPAPTVIDVSSRPYTGAHVN